MELLFFFVRVSKVKAFAFERRSCNRQNRLLSAANEAKPSPHPIPYSGSALTPKTSVKWLFGPPSYSASVEPPARFEPGECSSPETRWCQIYRDQISLIYDMREPSYICIVHLTSIVIPSSTQSPEAEWSAGEFVPLTPGYHFFLSEIGRQRQNRSEHGDVYKYKYKEMKELVFPSLLVHSIQPSLSYSNQ